MKDVQAAANAPAAPARVYEEFFVPALFQQWGETMSACAGIEAGQRVLDVACGTGALTRAAARRSGPTGSVVGLDASEEMLAVARVQLPSVEWLLGRAEALPFADASFDRVVSQFGLMFFEDPALALAEMRRVLRREGRLAVAVCDAIDHSPGYAVLAELLHRLFGAAVAEAFRAPFALGDVARLRALCRSAGLEDACVTRRDGRVRFASIGELIRAEGACVWTLGGLLDPEQLQHLAAAAEESLQPFVAAPSGLELVMPALIISAVR